MKEVFAAARITAESGPNYVVKAIMRELEAMNPTPSTEIEALVKQFENATTDYDGLRMADGEPPLEIIYCRHLRAAVHAIVTLSARVRELESALKPFAEIVKDHKLDYNGPKYSLVLIEHLHAAAFALSPPLQMKQPVEGL